MKVGTPGGSWSAREDVLPKDATMYREIEAWQLLLSKREKHLIIDTKDYHPGLLFLSKEDLEEMIKALGEQSSPELSQQLDRAKQEANERRQRLEQAEREASRDVLTDLYNRRHLDKAIQALYAQYRRGGVPFSIIMMEIDFFDNVNDTHGKRAGDSVLEFIGLTIMGSVKTSAVPARYRGEEFIVLLPATSSEYAYKVAESIRNQISSKTLKVTKTQELIGVLTVSCGVAQINDDDTVDSVVDRADEALYLAKKRGRNRVESEKDLPA